MSLFPSVATLEGEVLPEAVLEAFEMSQMNYARDEHRKLEEILLTFVIPAMGSYENQMARDIARHLEQIQSFSGNYCWRYRHLGASHGVVGQPTANGGLV